MSNCYSIMAMMIVKKTKSPGHNRKSQIYYIFWHCLKCSGCWSPFQCVKPYSTQTSTSPGAPSLCILHRVAQWLRLFLYCSPSSRESRGKPEKYRYKIENSTQRGGRGQMVGINKHRTSATRCNWEYVRTAGCFLAWNQPNCEHTTGASYT